MPKRDEDKDDFFMDDSMSMQAESPSVYIIFIYILWAKESPTAVDPPTAEAQSTRRMCWRILPRKWIVTWSSSQALRQPSLLREPCIQVPPAVDPPTADAQCVLHPQRTLLSYWGTDHTAARHFLQHRILNSSLSTPNIINNLKHIEVNPIDVCEPGRGPHAPWSSHTPPASYASRSESSTPGPEFSQLGMAPPHSSLHPEIDHHRGPRTFDNRNKSNCR